MSKVIGRDIDAKAWAIPEIGDAKQEAEQKKPPRLTKEEKQAFLAQLEKAKQQGYDEGFRKGQQEGFAAGQEQVDQTVESLVNIMHSLVNPIAQMEDRVEKELVNLALLIAKQIIRRELKTDPGQVVAVVREALSIIPSASQNVKVRLNPADADMVRQIIPSNAGERRWEVVEDPVLSQGSCLVETDSAQVDATFESRIAAIAAELLGSERRGDES